MIFGDRFKKKVNIEGMMCEHCKSKVENALSSIEGVSKVKVSLKDKNAIITSKVEIDDEIIKEKVTGVDKTVVSIENL